MEEISLRAYVKEIDNLVENEQLDEAIAHCRHILEFYPKHLDTYRALGKAYLEAKRYGDAADIFQRVLSAIPDDFVAHIGMAIVREDEENLDASIWHIERAFETNPANPAIQQELRRLIGRRDGLEPSKVHMTRGALARMYAHGELYPQAIAELISAIQDDPDRPDLQVLLATMHWRTEQHLEAAEICSHILDKLPYCRDANRIMAAILQVSDKSDEASSYLRRLAALDPYTAYITDANIDPQTVDADTVRFDKLSWQPGQPLPTAEPTKPEWVASLSSEMASDSMEEQESLEEPPSWVDEIETPAAQSIPTEEIDIQPTDHEEPSKDEKIPGWMQEAGWQKATGEAVEGRMAFSDEELSELETGVPAPATPSDEGELTPAEIPNWLMDKAPSEVSEVVPEEVELASETPSDLISEVEIPELEAETGQPPVEEPSIPLDEIAVGLDQEAQQIDSAKEPEDTPRLPAWLETETPGATATIVTWLEDKSSEDAEAPPEEQILEVAEAPSEEPILEVEEVDEVVTSESIEEAALKTEETIPDWLEQPVDLESVEDITPEEAIPDEEGPSWLEGVAEIAGHQEEVMPRATETPSVEAPASTEEEAGWLQGLAEPGAETSTEPPAPTEKTPDWLEGITEPEAEIAPVQPTARQEVPDWLTDIAEQSSVETPMDSIPVVEETPARQPDAGTIDKPTSQEETPDWLSEFAAAEGEEVVPSPGTPVTEEAELSDIQAPPITELKQEEEQIEAAPPDYPADIISDEKLDDEEVIGWLEGLASRQDVVDEETAVTTEEPVSVPPTPSEILSETPAEEEQVIPEQPEEGLEWLERLSAERVIDTDISPPSEELLEEYEEAEVSEWLEKMATQPIPKINLEELGAEAPEWLEQLDTGELAPSPEEPTPLEVKAEIEPVAPTPPQPSSEQPRVEPVLVEPEVEERPSMPPPPEPVEPVLVEPEIEERPPPPPEPVEPVVEVVTTVSAVPETPEEPPTPPKRAEKDTSQLLEEARQVLSSSDFERAAIDYDSLIKNNIELDSVINDLTTALERDPNVPALWQALGDAFMKNNQLTEAIEAYQKGMEVA
jgi:tetratricopeptide (TPR) repeat protein